MTLNTNISSMNANAALTNVGNSLYSSIEKLSTGLRINKAADDPSGLAIADKLRTQVSSTKQSLHNANLSISLLQIADKAMAEQSNILDIVKQRLVQGATSSTSDEGREIISSAIGALLNQFDEIAVQTRFQDKFLLQKNETDTDKTDKIIFVLGEFDYNTAEARDGIQANTQGLAKDGTLTLATLKSSSLSANGISFDDMKGYIDVLDIALDGLNTFRSDYGAVQQQVESTAKNLLSQQTSMSNAESAIRDVDYAKESASLKQAIIMHEAGSFALTQANLAKDYILKMLT
ncbi:MAG: flagellin [Arcobacteraceae bacterium]|nr:flagellin [Arcobacteraceae bacterium]MDY0327516.1 flagellin [Arcobacteraceae bacterium]